MREKKTAVLRLLFAEPNPIGIIELIAKLGSEVSERSIRRWLSEFVREGLVERTGQKRGSKYRSLQQSKASSSEGNGLIFGAPSEAIIKQIRRPLFERHPVSYDSQWLESYIPNTTQLFPSKLRQKLFRAGQRYSSQAPAGTFAHQIYNRLLIDLSYNSSRLEGNTYSLLDTQKLLIDGASVPGKLEEETVMITNHKEAIRFLVDNIQKLTISPQTIATIHFLLSDGLLEPSESGKVRTHSVRIGKSTYMPIGDPKKLTYLLDMIAEKASLIKNPFEQSLFLLVHITYLQAFADVNKRTARLCANIPLIKNNLVPLSFNDIGREDYNSASIALFELKNAAPMVDVYVFSYLRTCLQYEAVMLSMNVDEVRVRYRQQRRTIIRDIILKGVFGVEVEKFVSSQAAQIPVADQKDFLNDVLEDLRYIDHSRLAGLGVSPDQLDAWQKKSCRSDTPLPA